MYGQEKFICYYYFEFIYDNLWYKNLELCLKRL